MPRVVHFEIHADDPERAMRFYSSVFGWEFREWKGPYEYWVVRTGPDEEPGINGGLMRRQAAGEATSIIAFVCSIDVPSVDEYAARVSAGGGSIAIPKTALPGVGWLAYARDTEGNLIGLAQEDPEAR